MPVADKTRRGGNGDARDQDHHHHESRQRRQIKAECNKQRVNGGDVHQPDHGGQDQQIQQPFDVGDDQEAVDEMMDEGIDFLRKRAGQTPQDSVDDGDGGFPAPDQPDHEGDHHQGPKKEKNSGGNHPARQVVLRHENRDGDGQHGKAVEHALHDDGAERRGHFDGAFLGNEIGPGEFPDPGRYRGNGQKSDAGHGKERSLGNFFHRF